MFFREKEKSSQRKIHKSPAKQFIEIPLRYLCIKLKPDVEVGLFLFVLKLY